MSQTSPEERKVPFLDNKNTGPNWRAIGEKLQKTLYDKTQKTFDSHLRILPDVIYYKEGDKSIDLHLQLINKYFLENIKELGISCTASRYTLRDGGGSVIYFGHNDARPSNEGEFLDFLGKSINQTNETLLTVGATKLISANEL